MWSMTLERAYFMAISTRMVSSTPDARMTKVYSLRVGMTRSYTCIENKDVASANMPMKAEAMQASTMSPRYKRNVW